MRPTSTGVDHALPRSARLHYGDIVLDVLDTRTVRRWAVVARAALAARRAEIDALNVYPVPDGDTGTNLYLTLDQALDAVRVDHEKRGIVGQAGLVGEVTDVSRAILLTARGNSGVILSQLVRGVSEVIALGGTGRTDAELLAEALTRGAVRARESVLHPQEGTILSVADAAAAAATEAAASGGALAEVSRAIVAAARDALAATPEQLDVLARAGVVDAGGAGYLLFVEALDRVVRDETPVDGFIVDEFTFNPSLERRPEWSRPAVDRPAAVGGESAEDDGPGPAFEVMYHLDGMTDASVGGLRAALDELGDSVVVSVADDICRVHIHTDDIGAVLEVGIDVGRPRSVTVTPLETTRRPVPEVGLSVVACAAGPGIAHLFEASGARTIASGPRRRASAGELLDAVRQTGTADVILLPNDRDTRLAADAAAQAAGQDGQTVHVVASGTAVQGIAALAVFEPGTSASRNVVAMTRAAAATRHGAVTIAAKEGLTSGGPCQVGDVLGICGGDITLVGDDFDTVTGQVLETVLGSSPELVTLVIGEDAPEGLADWVCEQVRLQHRGVEVEVLDGGQPHYPLLIGAE